MINTLYSSTLVTSVRKPAAYDPANGRQATKSRRSNSPSCSTSWSTRACTPKYAPATSRRSSYSSRRRPSSSPAPCTSSGTSTSTHTSSADRSSVKDWLYGIRATHPGGDKDKDTDTDTVGRHEAEELLALYHILQWPVDQGGAGVLPGVEVKSIFALHNDAANQALMRHLSRRLILTTDDYDKIRDLFGTKVAFYFAFIQTYFIFLTFPAFTGVVTWLVLPKYSLAYAILTGVWCTVFLEYWKLQEIDLSIRWNVRGVNKVKINRPNFRYDSVIVESGRTMHYFPKRKQIARQLLQLPFILAAAAILGCIICAVFVVEVLISETYDGPYRFYLEYVPTMLLAIAMPRISASLDGIAAALTEYENHRTADEHEMSLTQKQFILSIITSYLPILLTAFVYVPFGARLLPRVKAAVMRVVPAAAKRLDLHGFSSDTDHLRNQVIALTVTGQISDFFDENIVPLLKHKLSDWYREYRRAYGKGAMLLKMVDDDPAEAPFLRRCRTEATLPPYNVQEDVAELVLQFGYLALFSPVWPLISLGFLINNWIELRSDFAKIILEFQRPSPTRSDGIGPWVTALEALTLLGSITTAAIVHLFGTDAIGGGSWTTLPITIFISEHALLLLRAFTRWLFERYGSEQIRKERNERYHRRLHYMDQIEASRPSGSLTPAEKERRKSTLADAGDAFWMQQVEEGTSAAAGLALMSMAAEWKRENRKKK